MGEERPIKETAGKLASLKNLYLTTDVGYLDFLGSIAGIGSFAEVSRHTISVSIFGIDCNVLDVDSLIKSKKSMGRNKDKQVVLELMALKKTQ